MVGLAVVSGIAGCTNATTQFGVDFSAAARSYLESQESLGRASLELDEYGPDAWTEAVIACPGAGVSDIANALGFESDVAHEALKLDFLGMAVFASDSEVLDRYLVGENDPYEDHFYFTACPGSPVDFGQHPSVVAFDRGTSLPVRFAPAVGYWYVEASVIRELS